MLLRRHILLELLRLQLLQPMSGMLDWSRGMRRGRNLLHELLAILLLWINSPWWCGRLRCISHAHCLLLE